MKLTSTFAVLFCFLAPGHAYILDESCNPYSDMLISGMQSAFDLAQAGSDTLSTLEKGSSSGDTQKAQLDLASYTFAEALTNGKVDTSNAKLKTVTDKFTSVLKYNSNNGQPDVNTYAGNYRRLPVDGGLVIFCDFSRYEEDQNCKGHAKPGFVCDTAVGVHMPMTDAYRKCKDPTSLWGEAGTYEWQSQGIRRPSEIQLCAGYVAKMQEVKIQTLAQEGDTPSLARDWSKIKPLPGGADSLPMDVASTFDVTLLHEMTHAVAGAPTKDIDGAKSYRWLNVVRLSGSGSTNNAESYAYFGLGSRMISPKANGPPAQRPMQDGTIEVLAQTSTQKRDVSHESRRQPWRRDPNITLTLDHTAVVLNASNTAGFVFTEPGSTKAVTISPGVEYTIGSDVIEVESAGIVYDHSTLAFPQAVSASTSASTSISKSLSVTNSSTGVSKSGPSTRAPSIASSIGSSGTLSLNQTSTRTLSSQRSPTQSSSSNSSSSQSISVSGSSTSSSSHRTSVSGSLASSSSQVGSQNKTASARSTGSSASFTSASSSGRISSSASATSTLSSTAPFSFTNSFSDVESTITPVSFSWFDVPTSTISGAAATSEAVLLGGLFFALQSNRKWLTDEKLKSQYVDSVKKTKEETENLLNSLSVKAPDMPDCSNTKRKRGALSERQVRALLANRGIIPSVGNAIEGAIHDVAKLVNCAHNVLTNLADSVDADVPDLTEIEDETDTLAEIATDLEKDGDDDTSSSQGSSSAKTTSSSQSSSSSCSTRTTSACDTSYSIFTPTGATTASTSTITLSCSTVTACSASLTGSQTTSTDEPDYSGTMNFDEFLAGVTITSWYDVQQSALAQAMGDTSDPYITWTSDTATTTNSSSTPTVGGSSGTAISKSTAASTSSRSTGRSSTGASSSHSISTVSSSGSSKPTTLSTSTLVKSSSDALPTLSKQCYSTSYVNCKLILSPATGTVCPSSSIAAPTSCNPPTTTSAAAVSSPASTPTTLPGATPTQVAQFKFFQQPGVAVWRVYTSAPGKESMTGRCGDVAPYFPDATIPQTSSVSADKVPFPKPSGGSYSIGATGNCVYTGDGTSAGSVKCDKGTVACSPYQTGTVQDCSNLGITVTMSPMVECNLY